MPFKDSEVKREYYRVYDKKYMRPLRKQQRDEYMANKSCPYCEEDDSSKLVIHHLFIKDPVLKNGNQQIWCWKESRRIIELLKCLVLCESCHNRIHTELKKGGDVKDD